MDPAPRQRGDRLKQLRAFCYAADLNSISRAADRILSSQPLVSRQIRALERQFAVTLFQRHGPRVVLTPTGRCLYRLARPLVEGMDRLFDTFVERYLDVPSSRLEIAAGCTTAVSVLPALLRQVLERHPEIRVNVRVASGRQRLCWLRSYQVDIVLAAVDVVPSDLEFRPILSSEIVLITPEDHPLAGRDSIDLAEAAACPAVSFPSDSYVGRVGDVIMRQRGHLFDTVLEVDEWTMVKRYVEAGVGIAAVPAVCLGDRDRVWRIPAGRWFPPRRYGILTRRDGNLSLAARRFMRLVDSGVSGEA